MNDFEIENLCSFNKYAKIRRAASDLTVCELQVLRYHLVDEIPVPQLHLK